MGFGQKGKKMDPEEDKMGKEGGLEGLVLLDKKD